MRGDRRRGFGSAAISAVPRVDVRKVILLPYHFFVPVLLGSFH